MVWIAIIIGLVITAWTAPGLSYWIGLRFAGGPFRHRFRKAVQKCYLFVFLSVVLALIAPAFAYMFQYGSNRVMLMGVFVVIGIALTGCGFAMEMIAEAKRLRRQARGQCMKCGYSLRGNVSGVCPECGRPIEEQ